MCILENELSSEMENIKRNQCLMTILRNILNTAPNYSLYQEPGISWLLSETAINRKQNQDAFPDEDFKATTIKMLQWAIAKTLKGN